MTDMTDNDGLVYRPPMVARISPTRAHCVDSIESLSVSVIRHAARVEASLRCALLFEAQLFEDVADSEGVMGSDAAYAVEAEDLVGDLGDGPLGSPVEALFDHGVPGVVFLAAYLLRSEMRPFKLGVGPVRFVLPISDDRFREEMIACLFQADDVYGRAADRPEPPAAGGVLDVDVLVGCPDKQTLTFFGYIVTTKRGPIFFLPSG